MAAPARPARRGASAGVALAFLAVMLGATLPTPLYPIYERELGFGAFTVTLVFAAYAVGVVATFLLLGRASDVVGRRPMMVVAVLVSALSAAVFATSPGLGWIYAARVVSGLSAGIATTVATVYLVELAPDDAGRGRAALVATVVNILGLGLGPLFAALVSLVGAPLVAPYVAHLLLLGVVLVGLARAPETVTERGGSLRPRLPTVAPDARAVFVPAAIAAFASFAALGLTTSVTAGLLGAVFDQTDRVVVGLVVLVLFAASALAQVALRSVPTRRALRLGCVVLAVGVALLGLSLRTTTLPLFLLALAVVGVGQALCFRAGVAAVTEQSPPALRARTVTSFFLVGYVGISFPVVLVGLASRSLGLQAAAEVFSVAVAVLALVALALQVVVARRASACHDDSSPRRRPAI